MPKHIALAETQGVLVVGRRIPTGSLTTGQLKQIFKLVDKFDDQLGDPSIKLAAVPGGDFTNAPGDEETLYDDVIVGHRSANGCANDMGPIGPYTIEQLREVVARCAKIPDLFWRAVAEYIPGDERRDFLEQTTALWMTSTGPLCGGSFAYGAKVDRATAEPYGVKFACGCTQGFVGKEPGDEESDEEGDEDTYDDDGDGDFFGIESQMSHDVGVAGYAVQVGYDGPQSLAIDLSDAAHGERVAAAAAVPGDKGYYVIGRYD